MSDDEPREIQLTEAQWREKLDAMQFHVLRQAGTERPFTGRFWNEKRAGTYHCAGCDTPLFKSDQKYESGCGWPSFFDELPGDRVETRVDRSHGMIRTEILCRRCGGHLGHVFPDGPPPTGTRYCVNSASLRFETD
ncbi:MAG: peptide-methionine (R)-S-oxide reductase MsrB [Alphaproteobacteria bacterium]|nr:peptide-methionine (R)-S-oxide reductase MsrB [Alphaproteobacteria bacterium]